jgi:hypothetical protein
VTGPPQAIRLSELPAAEARAIFDGYVAGQPERLAAFLAEVRRRGGPAGQLDQSLHSLDPLWTWFIAEHRPRRWFGGPNRVPPSPVPDEVMRASDPPWWYDFHPQFAQELGPYLAGLVTGLADYVFACALHARPASGWVVGRSSAHVRHPVFQIEGRGERVYASPITMALLALRGERNTEPVAPRRWLEQWLGMDPAWEAEMERLSRPLGAYVVEAIDHSRFTHQLSFDDAVAQRHQPRIARLVKSLLAERGVDEAVQEDREVVLVRAPGLSAAALATMVASLWKRRGRRSHAEPS